MFLEVSATLLHMEMNGRQRASAEYRSTVERLGLTPTEVARLGDIPDVDTVRDFMDGSRWPRTPTRAKLEHAVGWPSGSINSIALGGNIPDSSAADPVEAAIEASALPRGKRHRLIGIYYDMLEGQDWKAGDGA